MKRTCNACGKEFESEGHDLTEWLDLCHKCNAKRQTSDWRTVERKLNEIAKF